MFAVFDQSVANCPEILRNLHSSGSNSSSAGVLKDGSLFQHFSSVDPDTVTIKFGPGGDGLMAYSVSQNPLLPRLFSSVDNIYCSFQGHIENIAPLKQQYGLNKTANEVSIVIEAYRTLRDRGPYPPDQVVRDLSGKFAFILYDSSLKFVFVAADADGSVPLFWGADSEKHLVISDNEELVKKGCGKSYAPFPNGCFFTSTGGLKSFEYPLKELKPLPWSDSSGQICGATFVVGEESKKEIGIPRVGSETNWSSGY